MIDTIKYDIQWCNFMSISGNYKISGKKFTYVKCQIFVSDSYWLRSIQQVFDQKFLLDDYIFHLINLCDRSFTNMLATFLELFH